VSRVSSANLGSGDGAKIGNRPGGLVHAELVRGIQPGADCQNTGIDGLAALDVAGGVANDENLIVGEARADQFASPLLRDSSEGVSVFVVITETASVKMAPKVVMTKFNFGPQADVASEEAEDGRLGQMVEVVYESFHPWAWGAIELMEEFIEPKDITIVEDLEVLFGWGNAAAEEGFANDGGIRSAGKVDALDRAREVKLRGKGALERLHTSPAGAYERSIYVEEDQPYHIRVMQ